MNPKTKKNRIKNGPAGKILTRGKQAILFSVIAVFVLLGCVKSPQIGPQKWPAAGMGGFCAGDESITAGRDAARKAIQFERSLGSRHAFKKREEIRKLRDKAQCIFSNHAKRGSPDGMYFFALTLSKGAFGRRFRHPPNFEQVALQNLKKAALMGHGPAFILSLRVPGQRYCPKLSWKWVAA